MQIGLQNNLNIALLILPSGPEPQVGQMQSFRLIYHSHKSFPVACRQVHTFVTLFFRCVHKFCESMSGEALTKMASKRNDGTGPKVSPLRRAWIDRPEKSSSMEWTNEP
jgi:hypothetical protein